jgi:hypothetical protein
VTITPLSVDIPPDTGEWRDTGPLAAAARAVLRPLIELALARGAPYAEVDELVKQTFVEVAREAHAAVPLERAVSRVSATTGISRREVTRLLRPEARSASKPQSSVSQLFARWLSDPGFRDDHGPTHKIPRAGRPPSFESLAESVSRDMRPRALLEELCRLGMARINDEDDTVELLRDTFVPSADERQMFEFLGQNVGDHLAAAAANVIAEQPRHLEQALFADDLSLESIEQMRPLVSSQWQELVQSLAPVLQKLIDQDRAAGRTQNQRMRIGMYAYSATTDSAPAPDASANPTSQK